MNIVGFSLGNLHIVNNVTNLIAPQVVAQAKQVGIAIGGIYNLTIEEKDKSRASWQRRKTV